MTMIAILTIDKIPKNCNDNCICNHDGWCYAIHTGDGTSFDYQEAQNVRPLNCPLVELSKIPRKSYSNGLFTIKRWA